MIWNLSNIGTTAASSSKYTIYVANTFSVTTIDYITHATNTISMPGGCNPSGVALSLDGRKLYVGGQSSNVIYVINTKSNNIIKTISITEPTIFNLRMSPNGKLYVLCSGGNIVVINTITDAIIKTILLTGKSWDIAFSTFNGLAYATGGSNADVYAINYTTDDSLFNTYANASNCGIVIDPISYTYRSSHPKAGEVYFGIAANAVYAYNTYNGSTNTAWDNQAIYTTGAANGNIGTYPQGLAISPDGNSVYIANVGSSDITTLYPTASTTSVKTSLSTYLGTANDPFAVFLTSDGLYLYIGNPNTATVQIMDTISKTIITTIPITYQPGFITGGYIPN